MQARVAARNGRRKQPTFDVQGGAPNELSWRRLLSAQCWTFDVERSRFMSKAEGRLSRRPFLSPKAAIPFFLLLFLLSAVAQPSSSGRLIKVLPHYLDRDGHHSISPSLYDRDAYQAHLRRTPSARGGLRFDVQWKARRDAPLMLRVELRGTHEGRATSATLETALKRRGRSSRWASVALRDQSFRQFGELISWRASLWQDDKLLSEQKSFLW